MMPDDICREYADSDLKIKITESEKTVFIQGDSDALLFLAKLIAAQAQSPVEGFGISPFGAGCDWFSPGSTRGLYIHRIDKEVERKAIE